MNQSKVRCALALSSSCLLGAGLLLAGCASAPEPVAEPPGAPTLSIDTREGDAVQAVRAGPGEWVLDVRSTRGIGRAVVRNETGPWPERLVLRVHLAGLEDLRLTSGKQRLEISYLSHSQQRILQTQFTGDERQSVRELGPSDPRRAAVRVVDESGRRVSSPALPLSSGCFEITLPRAFLKELSDRLEISWIDFYR